MAKTNQPKSFVLMAKNGNLVEGYRVSILDQQGNEELVNLEGYSIGFLEHDGWIITNPFLYGGMGVFLNRAAGKSLEILGEL